MTHQMAIDTIDMKLKFYRAERKKYAERAKDHQRQADNTQRTSDIFQGYINELEASRELLVAASESDEAELK